MDRRARKVAKIARYHGVAGLLWRALARCASPVGSFYLATYYKKDLGQPLKVVRPKDHAALSISEAEDVDIDQIARRMSRSPAGAATSGRVLQRRADVVERIRCGRRCFVARVEGKVVHYCWVRFDRYGLPFSTQFCFPLRDHEAYIGPAYTVETWQGKGIFPAVLTYICARLQQEGYRAAYGHVRVGNRPPERVLERLGWEAIGAVLFFKTHRGRAWAVRLRGGPASLSCPAAACRSGSAGAEGHTG
jgi:GNAT superfamily N-acetyltransferase